MTYAAASMNLSEEAKQASGVLGEALNMACCIYDANFSDPEELDKAGAGEDLAEVLDFHLCDHSFNVRGQS